MTARHDMNARLMKEKEEVAHYDIHEETHSEWGLGANTSEVAAKSDDVQTRKLAFGLAEAIRKDWPRPTEQFGR